MSKLNRFIRSVSPPDMKTHLWQSDIRLPDGFNWDAPIEELSQGILEVVHQLSEQNFIQFSANIDRIAAMTDEVGQAALMALDEWRGQLEDIDGAYQRALWLYVRSHDAFRQAEEIRYADENQNAQRLWDGFVGPRLTEVKNDPLLVEQFKEALKGILGAGRIHIEVFGRVRSRRGEPDRDITQITVYSEDVPIDEVVFTAGGVRNQARKPVRETAITYEPGSGTIEVVGRVKTLRESVATLFAEKLLGVEFSGQRLAPRRVDLTPLADPMVFAVEPEDGIARVKLTRLFISGLDGRLTQSVEVPFSGDETLHEVLDEEYGSENPLRSQTRIWMARIVIQFEPDAGRKKGKKINVDLCLPKKCNVRGKTERERLLLNKYLKVWGFLRGEDR
jgi:hypothetical protein